MTWLTPEEFGALGFDPTPGDVEAFALGAASVRSSAAVFAEGATFLRSEESRVWRGQAAEAFRALMAEEFRPLLELAAAALGDSARAMDGWTCYQENAQAATRRLATQAVAAVAELERAQACAAALPAAPVPGTALPTDPAGLREYDALVMDHTYATNSVRTAAEDLASIRGAATRHGADYEAQSTITARSLKNALDVAPNEPGFWDKLGDKAGGLLDKLGNELGKLDAGLAGALAGIAPIAQVIGDLAGAVGAVCGVLAFVPGLQALGLVAVGLSLVALGGHYIGMAGSTGSMVRPFTDRKMLTTLAMDGVGFVAGAKAYQAGKAIEGIVDAARLPTRTVSRFGIGKVGLFGTKEVPEGLFGLATRGPYAMGPAELSHRVVQFRGDAVGLGVSALESGQHRQAFANLGRLADPGSTPLPTLQRDPTRQEAPE